MARFLRTCRYVSDEEQFGEEDYWLPPEEFEQTLKGDCEDFSLWAWRQLINMGYDCRFVVGMSGRYGDGHAWIQLDYQGHPCILEPLACHQPMQFPRLSSVRYKPSVSVACVNKKLKYFRHDNPTYRPSLSEAVPLVAEWSIFWLLETVRLLFLTVKGLLLLPFRLVRKLFRRAR
jgi:hypothetical protein